MTTFIYGLKDPLTKEIRYIGKSDSPSSRYQNHLSMSAADVNRHKKNWIKSLQQQMMRPELVILERVNDESWEERERWWIAKGRKDGWPLTNLSEGGRSYAVASDTAYDMISALSFYLSPEKAECLSRLEFNVLHDIALMAVRSSIPLSKGFFGGRNNGRHAYEEAKRVINACVDAAISR